MICLKKLCIYNFLINFDFKIKQDSKIGKIYYVVLYQYSVYIYFKNFIFIKYDDKYMIVFDKKNKICVFCYKQNNLC